MFLFRGQHLFPLFIAIPLFLILGCSESDRDENLAPRISVFKVESEIVEPGTPVDIRFEATDVNGDRLSVEWRANGGTIRGDDRGATWIAPEEERKYVIEVTVSDGRKSTTSIKNIRVWRTRPGDYYPLAVGNIWHYRDDEGNRVIFEIVDTIDIQVTSDRTVKSYVLQKSSPDEGLEGILNFSYLGQEIENGVVKGILQHAQNITSGTEDTILFSPFLPLYNFPLIPGEEWQINFQAKLTPELFPIGGGADEFEVLAEETMTVPAGTFENVFQVQETFKWSIFDHPLDITVAQKWLAPNVGIIKFTQSQTRDDITVDVEFELESFELVDEQTPHLAIRNELF